MSSNGLWTMYYRMNKWIVLLISCIWSNITNGRLWFGLTTSPGKLGIWWIEIPENCSIASGPAIHLSKVYTKYTLSYKWREAPEYMGYSRNLHWVIPFKWHNKNIAPFIFLSICFIFIFFDATVNFVTGTFDRSLEPRTLIHSIGQPPHSYDTGVYKILFLPIRRNR